LKRKILLSTLILLIITSFLILAALIEFTKTQNSSPEVVYVGVTADGNVTAAKTLIDKTKDFINLLIINNPNVIKDKTSLKEVCDYARRAGLSFFVHMKHPAFWQYNYNPLEWITEAKAEYGRKFLGIYLYDEPGGNQLDRGDFRQFDETTMPHNYLDAANTYVYYLYVQMRDFIKIDKLVTSDYGLFWFDYEAGYDAVFCEFGANRVKELNIALCRGAAEMHNKTWGVMITWSYDNPPYIESAVELYEDMVTAYQAGAKYIAVFNYPETGPYGLLTEEHLSALKQFKEFVSKNPQNKTSNLQKIAYVLPENYGWGLRSPTDKIWGVWEADDKSPKIWSDLTSLIREHDCNFDIVVASPWTRLFAKQHYNTLIWWDGRIQQLNP
jgi:hypothetical protein